MKLSKYIPVGLVLALPSPLLLLDGYFLPPLFYVLSVLVLSFVHVFCMTSDTYKNLFLPGNITISRTWTLMACILFMSTRLIDTGSLVVDIFCNFAMILALLAMATAVMVVTEIIISVD